MTTSIKHGEHCAAQHVRHRVASSQPLDVSRLQCAGPSIDDRAAYGNGQRWQLHRRPERCPWHRATSTRWSTCSIPTRQRPLPVRRAAPPEVRTRSPPAATRETRRSSTAPGRQGRLRAGGVGAATGRCGRRARAADAVEAAGTDTTDLQWPRTARHPFGFKLSTAVGTPASSARVDDAADWNGAASTLTIQFTSVPTAGDTVTVSIGLKLPDGTSDNADA